MDLGEADELGRPAVRADHERALDEAALARLMATHERSAERQATSDTRPATPTPAAAASGTEAEQAIEQQGAGGDGASGPDQAGQLDRANGRTVPVPEALRADGDHADQGGADQGGGELGVGAAEQSGGGEHDGGSGEQGDDVTESDDLAEAAGTGAATARPGDRCSVPVRGLDRRAHLPARFLVRVALGNGSYLSVT